MRCAAGISLVALLAAACAQGPEADSPASRTRTGSPSSATPTSAAASPAVETRDPLEPEVLDRSPGGDEKYFYFGEGGTKLAMLNWVGTHPRMRTRYRIYGPGWKPRTPLLQVPGVLEILGPVSGGFLGHAFVLNHDATTRMARFVLVAPDGSLRPVEVTRDRAPLEASDEVLWGSSGRLVAYRPSTGQLRRLRYAEAKLPSYAFGAFDTDTGDGCALAVSGDDVPSVYWTTDAGHSWKHMTTRQLLGSDLPADMCEPAGDGRIVMAGSDPMRGVARASTVALATMKVSASYRLDSRFLLEEGQIFPVVLPDGRLVFPTLRRGLMVATDRTNSTFVFRPGPVSRRNLVGVVGGDLVHQNWGRRRDLLDVSSDAGRTWHVVDLEAGGWTATD